MQSSVMSERHKQTAFLKRLLQRETSAQERALRERIVQAERDEKCVRTAMQLVGVTGLLCACGICYEAIFLADFFTNPAHVLTRFLSYMGCGSFLCWVVFLGYWWWHRALTNRLCEEGRRSLEAKADPATTFLHVVECSASSPDPVPKQDMAAGPVMQELPRAA